MVVRWQGMILHLPVHSAGALPIELQHLPTHSLGSVVWAVGGVVLAETAVCLHAVWA